jgi:hypothetical protein
MDNLSAAWLYPIIIIAGVLQAWELLHYGRSTLVSQSDSGPNRHD